jgi:hypothetical protein
MILGKRTFEDERLGGPNAFTIGVRLGVASGVRRVALPTDLCCSACVPESAEPCRM